MRATLYHHPSAPVVFDKTADPREQAVRADALDLYEAVERLMARFGAQRVATVVRNIAAIKGVS